MYILQRIFSSFKLAISCEVAWLIGWQIHYIFFEHGIIENMIPAKNLVRHVRRRSVTSTRTDQSNPFLDQATRITTTERSISLSLNIQLFMAKIYSKMVEQWMKMCRSYLDPRRSDNLIGPPSEKE